MKWLANLHHLVCLLTTLLSVHGSDTHCCFSDFTLVIFSDQEHLSLLLLLLPLLLQLKSRLFFPDQGHASFFKVPKGISMHSEFPTHPPCDNYNVSCHYLEQCFSSSLPCIEQGPCLSQPSCRTPRPLLGWLSFPQPPPYIGLPHFRPLSL